MAKLAYDYQTVNALLTFAQQIGLVDGVVESDGSHPRIMYMALVSGTWSAPVSIQA